MRRCAARAGAILICVAAVSVADPGVAGAASCGAAPTAGSHLQQFAVGGTQRSALIHVPSGIQAGQPTPLVLALHGFGSSGPKMQSYSGFSRVADQHGFIIVYPSSSGSFWNSNGRPRLPDDVAFLGVLIKQLERDLCVDAERVFATGVSNGGGMVALAACELSDQIAAIAPVAGGYDGQPPCHPSHPVSVLEIHGISDPVVPYFGQSRRRTRSGMPPFVDGWVGRDGCFHTPDSRRLATRTSLFSWSGCTSGVNVEHVRITLGRHQWPGATPPDPGPRSTICGACTIWSFFSSLGAGPRMWSASGGAGLLGS